MEGRRLRLPKAVGLVEMRHLMSDVSIIFEREAGRWRADFRPGDRVLGIEIDRSAVEIITAECESLLDAMMNWLELIQVGRSEVVPIRTSDSRNMPPYLARRMRSERYRDRSLIVLPAKIVELPNLMGKTGPSLRKGADRIAKEVELISSQLETELSAYDWIGRSQRELLLDWAMEFYSEALLNVAQHAANSADVSTVLAHVAAGYVAKSDFRKLVTGRREPNPPAEERAWEARLTSRNHGCLDLAVSDSGQGVPGTLETAYRQALRAEPAGIDVGDVDVDDDDILVWALSAFGTRKRIQDYATQHDAMTWRGLYRLLRRCTNQDGFIRLTSAAGEVGCIVDENGKRIQMTPRGARARSPITTIRAAVPVDAGQSVQRAVKIQREHEPQVVNSIGGVIIVPTQSQGYSSDIDKVFEVYSHAVRLAVTRRIAERPDEAAPWVVVHTLGPLHGEAALRADTRENQIAAERRMAELAARIVVAVLAPTHTLIHTFLPGSDRELLYSEVSDLARDLIGKLHPLTSTALLGQSGISIGGSHRIRWLLSPQGPMKDDQAGTWSRRLWARLLAYRPDAAAVRDQPRAEFSPDVAKNLATSYLRMHIEHADPGGGRSSRAAWFWRSKEERGQAQQVVVTGSGRRATQYLSVLGFCHEHSLFLHGIAETFAAVIRRWAPATVKRDRQTIVITDSERSRFLLNSVREKLSSLEPGSDAARALSGVLFVDRLNAASFVSNTRCLIFADFRDQGQSIGKRIEEVRTVAPSNVTVAIRVFVAIDHARASRTPDPNLNDLNEARRPETVDAYCEFHPVAVASANEQAPVLTIDPVTSEPFSKEQSVETASLKSVSWDTTGQDGSLDLSCTRFVHGLQRIGGRYSTIRWPVSENLENKSVIQAIAKRLAGFVDGGRTPAALCVCIRQDSAFQGAIHSILRGVMSIFRNTESPKVTLSYAVLTTHVFHGSQSLGGSVHQALRAATHFRGEASQLNLELEDAGGAGDANRKFTHIAFLDNSAVTGRAIFEFLNSARTLGQYGLAQPSNVLIFPLVSRLDPAEERLLLSIRLMSGQPDATAKETIDVSFAALVQLRLPSYSEPWMVPLHAELKRVHARSVRSGGRQFLQISDAIGRVLERLERSLRMRESSVLHGSVLGLVSLAATPSRDISLPAVEFRQLLALANQGVPCTAEAAKALQGLKERGGTDLMNILAFEPELLRTDPLVFESSGDIRKLVLEVAFATGEATEKVVIINALWVLAHIPSGLSNFVQEAPNTVLHSEIVTKLLIFLCLYCTEPAEARKTSVRLRDRLQGTELSGWLRDEGQALLLAMDTDTRQTTHLIENEDAAREAIRSYLRRGRSDHAGRLTEDWKKAQEFFAKFDPNSLSTSSPDPTEVPAAIEATEAWFDSISQPLQYSLEFLSGNRPDLSRKLRSERERSANGLTNVKVRASAWAEGRALREDVFSVWRDFLRVTLWDFCESVYRRRILRAASGRKWYPEATEISLSRLANMPLIILLAELNRELDVNIDAEITLNLQPESAGLPPVEVFAKLPDVATQNSLVRALWFVHHPLPLLWQGKAEEFRSVCMLLSGNLARYSNPAAVLKVHYRLERDAQGARVAMAIYSTTRAVTVPGQGAGRESILQLVEKNGWIFTDGVSQDGRTYASELTVEVELLEISVSSFRT
jgi:hypothetical protein